MTSFTNSKQNNSKTSNNRQLASIAYLLPEVIEAISLLFLASIGAVIGVAMIIKPPAEPTIATAGMGLAGTAIAGAAGLARTGRSEQGFSVKERDGNLDETPADR